jgi:hypothetical protein
LPHLVLLFLPFLPPAQRILYPRKKNWRHSRLYLAVPAVSERGKAAGSKEPAAIRSNQ